MLSQPKFMENMTADCLSPLKSECTFYQSEIFSDARTPRDRMN